MKKILIFRTDRVGDFILCCILIKSIKRNKPDSEITVICSEQNYEYVKNYSLVDKAKLYPKDFIKFYAPEGGGHACGTHFFREIYR